MNLPPGIRFLFQQSPNLFLPPVITYVFLNFLVSHAVLFLPSWCLPVISFLALPVTFVVPIVWKDRKDARLCQLMGAEPLPLLQDSSFGGTHAIGVMLDNMKDCGYPGDFMADWPKIYGPAFQLKLMFKNMIFTTEPAHLKAVLATQFDNFVKGADLIYQMHGFFGDGVFNSDGDIWKFHRAITRPFFVKSRISDFDIFDRHAEKAIAAARARLDAGFPIDFLDMVSRFTMDSATEFLFGSEMHSIDRPLPYPHNAATKSTEGSAQPDSFSDRFAKAFTRAQSLMILRTITGNVWPLVEFFEDKVAREKKVIDEFVEPIIRGAIEKRKGDNREVKKHGGNDVAEVQEGDTLLDHLVRQSDDPVLIKDETINILVAGRDSTSTTLTFVFYMLAEYPHVLKRLREEILKQVGPSRRPTTDDFKEMKYLRAVINETLRLYPPVPNNSRQSINATTFPPTTPGGKPLFVPGGTKVLYSVFMMHRRTDLWGPDAMEFDPDRFIDDRLKYLIANPYIFIPFNAGPRICLGQQFAYHEASFFIVRTLQTFSSVELDLAARSPTALPDPSWAKCPGRQGKEKVRLQTHATSFVKEGLWVRLGEA